MTRYSESKHWKIWAWCLKPWHSLCRTVQPAKMIGSSPWSVGVHILATSWYRLTDCPLLLPQGWWRQQMEVSECGDLHRSIDSVCFNNPTWDDEMKPPQHSQNPLFFLQNTSAANIRKKKKKGSNEIATREPLWGRGERNGDACWSCIYQYKHPIRHYFIIFFAYTFNLVSIYIQNLDRIISFS